MIQYLNSLYFKFGMRDNHLSFAKVLQKRKHASVKQLKVYKLRDLLQQYEYDPDADYTIYLAKRGENEQRRRNKQIKQMGFDENEQGFDGWLEKQSNLKSNKENRSIQEKIISKRRQQQQTQMQFGLSPKGKDKRLRTVNNLPKQQKIMSNKSFNRSRIDTNEQKQSQQKLKLQNQHSQTHLFPSSNNQIINNKHNRDKHTIQSQNGLNVINELQYFHMNKQGRNNSRMDQLITGTQTIHIQIAQLAKSLIKQNAAIIEDESYLQQYQSKQYQIPQIPYFANESSKGSNVDNMSQEDSHKRRFQSAKHELEGYLDKFMKNKSRQTNKQSIKASPITTQIVVGFSFSPQITFINQQSSQNELHINHIHQAQSQIPSQIINDSKFNELKKNFPSHNLKIENQNIIDIESVRYNNDTIIHQNENSDNIPQISKQIRLMPSTHNEEQQKQHKKGAFMEIQDIFEMKKVTKKDQNLSGKPKGGPFSTKIILQQKPPHQKLSLISHNKQKSNTVQTNKTSPKIKLTNLKQPKTQITQFASSSSPKQPQQTCISSSNEGSRGTIKSIRDVKYSIVNPNVLHPSNNNFISDQQYKSNNKNMHQNDSHKNSAINIRFNYQNRQNSSVQPLFHKKQQKQTISYPKLQQTQNMNKITLQRQKTNKNEIPLNPNPSNYTQPSESSEFIFDI